LVRDKVDFATLIGCHGNVPSVIAKQMQNLSSTYIHSSINSETLVKIRPVVTENSLLIGRPLKYKERKKTS